MDLIFLEAPQPLTKEFKLDKNGQIEKSAYPNVWEFTSHEASVKDLADFAKKLEAHAALGHCLLKGKIGRALVKESRAGSTDSNGLTDWVCLDIDGLPVKSVEDFLKAVGLADVSYVVQYSTSYKMLDNELRAHVFMQLDAEYPAPLLKQWLIDLNHKTDLLRNAMSLTKTDTAIRWALDISVCQNDKLIYIAPPKLGRGLKDPLPKNQRIKYIKKANQVLTISGVTNVSANQDRTNKRINELREARGLPARKFSYKIEDGNQVLAKPDRATTYESRSDRGFTYFNINGGDSWGYYHPDNNPKYIFNFKGEPVYLTKDLIPEYWDKVEKQKKQEAQDEANKPITINPDGKTYLAFSDRRTSTYYKGWYEASTNTLDLSVAKTAKHITDFVKAHGLPYEDFIPEWDLVFDPLDTVRVDPVNRVINTFEPTEFMQAQAIKRAKAPKLIHQVVCHALNDQDGTLVTHFYNWLAFIVQNRCRTKTAWVLHGTEGTGKGTLFHRILKPLFGHRQTVMKRMGELNGAFNGYIENRFIVVIDEIESRSLVNESSVMADLRNFITEPEITINEKHQVARTVHNYANWLFYSNKPGAVAIPKEDRRYNVGHYQPDKLVLSDSDLEQIDAELQAFHDFLLYYPVDEVAVATPIETQDRAEMISISESSVDTVGSALLDGNYGYLIDQLPTVASARLSVLEARRAEDYSQVLIDLLERTERNSGVCNIGREELRIIFDYTVGNVPSTPNKFTSMLKHHRIHVAKVWVDGKTVNGIKVVWKDTDEFDKYKALLKPEKAQPATPAAKPKAKVTKVK